MSKGLTFSPVESSAIQGYHYEPESRALTVQFKGGKAYTYADVSEAKLEALKSAPSFGSHFATHIKPHHRVMETR